MAFTIRAWSRRTVRQTFFQSMECQSGVRSGAAPAGISAADISALLPGSVGRGSLVTEDPREVSPLSRRSLLPAGATPYPSHYRTAFACSRILYPLSCQVALRLPFPKVGFGSAAGLPRSAG